MSKEPKIIQNEEDLKETFTEVEMEEIVDDVLDSDTEDIHDENIDD